MDNASQMTPEMLAGLLQHVFREGMTAFEQNYMDRAGQWFTQCLSILHGLGGNKEFLSQVMFYLGYVMAFSNEPQQAAAFLLSSASIQKSMGKTEAEADCFFTTGSVLGDLKAYRAAESCLLEASQRYHELGLPDKFSAVEKERATFASHEEDRFSPDNGMLEFGIYADTDFLAKLSVSTEGEVTWCDGESPQEPVPIGLAVHWQSRYLYEEPDHP